MSQSTQVKFVQLCRASIAQISHDPQRLHENPDRWSLKHEWRNKNTRLT